MNRILVIEGQGIGIECVAAAKKVLTATGVPITFVQGSLGSPDSRDMFKFLKEHSPAVYLEYYGNEDPISVADRLESQAKNDAQKATGNINDFYKKLLANLPVAVVKEVKSIVGKLERNTLHEAQSSSAVLKGALRTLDEGDEPSRNVTIRKAFEQYANIRRCLSLDPIAPGMKDVDILFVRENVEDLYASIEHRLGRNYLQALRHNTTEGSELIIRAAFEAAIRDGRKKVTGLEKPNILKITGGMFKEIFLRIAKEYSKEKLGAERGIDANFMIIDDGLAAIAATPEKFDVVVTSNMFGDIGSDIAAKVSGGVGLVSSNNTNPNNSKSVSMFETMGGTADDIAGKNLANPVALIDAAAEMLLHIGGPENVQATELIKAAVLQVLADGYYVGDIKKGPYQTKRGKERLGTQEFTQKIIEKIESLKLEKSRNPNKTIKELALATADEEVRPLFEKALRSYAKYTAEYSVGSDNWVELVKRNSPPNPTIATSRIAGFDLFVDDSGMRVTEEGPGKITAAMTAVEPKTRKYFEQLSKIKLESLFNENTFGSVQAIRSFAQYAHTHLTNYIRSQISRDNHAAETQRFENTLVSSRLDVSFMSHFSSQFLQLSTTEAMNQLENFNAHSIKLIQSFYYARAKEISPILQKNGFHLVRITSRGTEIFPTMCDYEKREVDRFRIEIDPNGPLAGATAHQFQVAAKVAQVQVEMAKRHWILVETILNRPFVDISGPHAGKERAGVSLPYAKSLGANYKIAFDEAHLEDANDDHHDLDLEHD